LLPPQDLIYAIVEKKRSKGRVISINYKVIFGKEEEIQELLADSAVSAHINTAFVERHNLTLRQHSRRLTRKTNGFSKERNWLERQLHLFFGYYHFCLPHGGLRRKLEYPLPTKGNGSLKRWVDLTPAMSAGITDHVWSMQELMNYRLPAQILARVVKGH
jgi:hypothetical protein